MRVYDRVCPACEQDFRARHPSAVFCSQHCRDRNRRPHEGPAVRPYVCVGCGFVGQTRAHARRYCDTCKRDGDIRRRTRNYHRKKETAP